MSDSHLTMGFIAMSLNPTNAFNLFNHLLCTSDCRVAGIQYYQDGSYRSSTYPNAVLDYHVDPKGTVIQQEAWKPMQPGDVHRHVQNARLCWPVFFLRVDHIVGIELSAEGEVRTRQMLVNPNMPAPLGGLTTTHLCLKWPGYGFYKKQVEIQDANKNPIRMSKLAERISKFIGRWIEEAAQTPIDPRLMHWRVGPGFITKEHIYVVGLVQVSAGTWQPILQLKGLNFH
ncbi:hypothetical protein PENSPDRAFT_751121 [Peniophora sp. CONT]|nr:hypothetical protein PENSPDRAFT_751121 [Peniophora sp. CONT]